MTDPTRLHPDFGLKKAVLSGDPDEGYICNAAMAAELARRAGTPKGTAFYRAFAAEWRKTEGWPLSNHDRDLRCMRAGRAAAAVAPSLEP